MLVNDTPQNEAIMSNVGEIGEFRIRNSAKAFSILSSGLYANKIKAIVRELSTNARDSHTAAGKADVPFSIHLPNSIEPWFAVRDFGTGLDHEQVVNIYTTYFESTKTTSNDYVGCLGLGSKSPFSYTDNFTVTAIKDGKKRIYTAFINDHGVPSIAKMFEEDTDEPAGLEVKFSVENQYDFSKFVGEASEVYRWFDVKPTASGAKYEVRTIKYETENIIPGVHSSTSVRGSYAVMGNIAYPIDVPNADTNLGNLASMLHCGLVMEFGIGELDIQASREGLSYIPQTIQSIKDKLIALQAALAIRLAEDANKIDCLWARAEFLVRKANEHLWKAAVDKHVLDTQFALVKYVPGNWEHLHAARIDFSEEDLAKKYNIVVRGFSKGRGIATISNVRPSLEVNRNVVPHEHRSIWSFIPGTTSTVTFVKNDTTIGATERAKYHWRKQTSKHTEYVYVLDKADKEKPAQFDAFLKDLYNPPNVVLASSLLKKERVSTGPTGQTVSLLKLEQQESRYYRRYSSEDNMVWRTAGKVSALDQTKKYFYLPLKGYQLETPYGYLDAKTLVIMIKESGLGFLDNQEVYGVRKTEVEAIKTMKNWVNLEEHIKSYLSGLTPADIKTLVAKSVYNDTGLRYNATVTAQLDPASPYVAMFAQFVGIKQSLPDIDSRTVKKLAQRYGVTVELDQVREALTADVLKVKKRYEMLDAVNEYRVTDEMIIDYINMVDQVKGI